MDHPRNKSTTDIEERAQLDRDADVRAGGVVRQQQDADDVSSAVPVGVMTRGQARGAVLFGVIGAVIGAALFSLLALIPMDDVSVGMRLGFALVVGAIAGGVAGAVFGGGWESDREARPRRDDRQAIVEEAEGPRAAAVRANQPLDEHRS